MLRTCWAAASLLLVGCVTAPLPAAAPAAAVAVPPRGPDASRFTALMINGGGNPSVNYQAHLAHLRELRALLLDGGIPSEKITLFSADGADPAPDLVSREAQPEADFWRLHGTPVERALETPRVIVSSEIPGAELHAATKAGIAAWFDQAKPKLHGGDVLLLYVTDHGLSGGRDPLDNTILLWNKETLSVRELGAMIDGLDPGVRVVMLMSQCYSGGFASLSLARRAGPLVCGYFASTADRPAYGCFPENRGKEKAGHAFQFIRALAATRRMEDAQAAVLVGDDTPDVPLKSSDVYLEAALARGAKARGITIDALASEILPGPDATPGREVVQRIAASAGLPAPGKLAEVDALRASLPDLARRLDRSATAWHGALGDANTGNLGAFLADHPTWAPKLHDPSLAQDQPAARALTASLLADLASWSRGGKAGRAEILHEREEAAEAAAYRAEVRLAAAIRIRTLLVDAAARTYLARGADPAEREGYEALRACEDLTLPGLPGAPRPVPEAAAPAPFPPLADDLAIELGVRPSWAGIVFGEVGAALRKDRGKSLPDGASLVTGVYPGSPASAAGIEVGDVVLGPPGAPFSARNEVRPWTMTSRAGASEPLELLRGSSRVTVTLTPREMPEAVPPMPSPLVGMDRKGPPIDLVMYRGNKPSPADKRRRLFYFWATWCKPCKAALPELVALEKSGKVQLIAVTDEGPDALDAFFKTWKTPFPRTIAIDAQQKVFPFYAGNARPTFVQVDADGFVRSRIVGYDRERGLEVPGWTWSGK